MEAAQNDAADTILGAGGQGCRIRLVSTVFGPSHRGHRGRVGICPLFVETRAA